MRNYKQVLNKLAESSRPEQAATLIMALHQCGPSGRLFESIHSSCYFVFNMQPFYPIDHQYVLSLFVSCGQLPVARRRPFIGDFWPACLACDWAGMLLLWPQLNQLPAKSCWPVLLFHPKSPTVYVGAEDLWRPSLNVQIITQLTKCIGWLFTVYNTQVWMNVAFSKTLCVHVNMYARKKKYLARNIEKCIYLIGVLFLQFQYSITARQSR